MNGQWFAIIVACLTLSIASPLVAQPRVSTARPKAMTLERTYGALLPDSGVVSSVDALAIRRDGAAYVIDRAHPFVVEYDRQGQLVRTIGRQGDGPGEFRSPDRLGLVGDTLWVSDDSHRRISFFGIDGKFIRSEAITAVATTGMSPAMPIALTADGYIIVAPSPYTVGDAQIVQRTVPIMRISRTSKRPDTIALLTYTEKQPSFRVGPKAITYLNDPLPDRPLRSVSPDGRYVLVVERGGWAGWRPGEARVRILESSGETKYTMLLRNSPIKLSASERDAILSRYVSGSRRRFQTDAEAERVVAAALRLPDFYPAVSAAAFSTDGTFWLAGPMAGDSVLWTIYNVQGLIEYSLTTPHNAVIAAMHRDSVWLLTSDDDGVQVLSRYRVSP